MMHALWATMPRKLLPMLATSSAPFDDAGCLFQLKWDGVRAMAGVTDHGWRLWGREGVQPECPMVPRP